MKANTPRTLTVFAALACCVELASADSVNHGAQLQPAPSIATINDERERSVALFTEAGKVIQSPRCMNCHPVEQRPTQGDVYDHS